MPVADGRKALPGLEHWNQLPPPPYGLPVPHFPILCLTRMGYCEEKRREWGWQSSVPDFLEAIEISESHTQKAG